jgi:hypothetical protein
MHAGFDVCALPYGLSPQTQAFPAARLADAKSNVKASLANFTSIVSRLLLADRGPFLDSIVESSSSALAESDSEENWSFDNITKAAREEGE